MQLFQPQITLIETTTGTTAEYFLHVITLCDRTGYLVDGYEPLPTVPDANGVFPVTLKITENTVDSFAINKSVDHLIFLGNIPLSAPDPWIEVSIKKGGETKGKGVVHVESAESDSRPGPT